MAGSCTWRLNREDAEKADDVARRACAAHAVVGIRTFDCGDIYAGVEDLVGRFLATARGQHRALFESVRLHTKVAPDLDALARLQPVAGEAPAAQRQREAAVARFVEGSVWRSANRLSASVVDLVFPATGRNAPRGSSAEWVAAPPRVPRGYFRGGPRLTARRASLGSAFRTPQNSFEGSTPAFRRCKK